MEYSEQPTIRTELPDKYRLIEDFPIFLEVVKTLVLHPSISTLDRLNFTEWLAPSFFISNGHFVSSLMHEIIPEILELHSDKLFSTSGLGQILSLLHWLELSVPWNVQEEILTWLKEYNKQQLLSTLSLGVEL